MDFWHDHPGWAAWRITAPYRWATWGALAAGLAGEPAIRKRPMPTAKMSITARIRSTTANRRSRPQSSTRTKPPRSPTVAAENLNPAASEWLPLGVFAVTQDRQASGPVPTLFMQLAVNKEGVISGTFKNETTGETQSLEGMVDKKSQRVAWCVQGKSWPIVETGLSNLTQETFPALLHFADGQTQQWLFVRLEEPKKTP